MIEILGNRSFFSEKNFIYNSYGRNFLWQKLIITCICITSSWKQKNSGHSYTALLIWFLLYIFIYLRNYYFFVFWMAWGNPSCSTVWKKRMFSRFFTLKCLSTCLIPYVFRFTAHDSRAFTSLKFYQKCDDWKMLLIFTIVKSTLLYKNVFPSDAHTQRMLPKVVM